MRRQRLGDVRAFLGHAGERVAAADPGTPMLADALGPRLDERVHHRGHEDLATAMRLEELGFSSRLGFGSQAARCAGAPRRGRPAISWPICFGQAEQRALSQRLRGDVVARRSAAARARSPSAGGQEHA